MLSLRPHTSTMIPSSKVTYLVRLDKWSLISLRNMTSNSKLEWSTLVYPFYFILVDCVHPVLVCSPRWIWWNNSEYPTSSPPRPHDSEWFIWRDSGSHSSIIMDFNMYVQMLSVMTVDQRLVQVLDLMVDASKVFKSLQYIQTKTTTMITTSLLVWLTLSEWMKIYIKRNLVVWCSPCLLLNS